MMSGALGVSMETQRQNLVPNGSEHNSSSSAAKARPWRQRKTRSVLRGVRPTHLQVLPEAPPVPKRGRYKRTTRREESSPSDNKDPAGAPHEKDQANRKSGNEKTSIKSASSPGKASGLQHNKPAVTVRGSTGTQVHQNNSKGTAPSSPRARISPIPESVEPSTPSHLEPPGKRKGKPGKHFACTHLSTSNSYHGLCDLAVL